MIAERATIDFETKSCVNIKKVGAWIYSRDRSTRVACLAFLLPGDDPAFPSLWHSGYLSRRGWVDAGMLPGSPHVLAELFVHISRGGLVEAHNYFFEKCIWTHIFSQPTQEDAIGLPDHSRGVSAPLISDDQWRCSMVKACSFTLPRGLGEACAALDLPVQKDEAGNRLMKRMCKPRKPRKSESRDFAYFVQGEDLHIRLFEYCKTDVSAEHALSSALPDLTPSEYKIWRATEGMNWRGVRVDLDLCRAAIDMDQKTKVQFNRELHKLTGIESGTKRAQLLTWLKARGVKIDDTTAATLDEVHGNYSTEVNRALWLIRDINKTSVTKYASMLAKADLDDHRVRDLMMHHGATTGRWTGKGIQVQNFPRGKFGGAAPWNITPEEGCERVLSGDSSGFDNPLDLLSSCTRGALIPSEGKKFLCADYSAIEARIVFWLAGDENALDIYRAGRDLYCHEASMIYRREVTKKDKRERQFGKIVILSLGFGVGFLTFCLRLRAEMIFTPAEAREILGDEYEYYVSYVNKVLNPQKDFYKKAADPIAAYKGAVLQARLMRRRLTNARLTPEEIMHELALCRYVVSQYREQFPLVPQAWEDYEKGSTQAVRNPGKAYTTGLVTWEVVGDYLTCKLPSGRRLHYRKPFLKTLRTPWGQEKEQLHFWGVNKDTRKWSVMHTYGASLFENAAQAISRDITAHALVTQSETPILLVHDELLSEVDDDHTRVDDYIQQITTLPAAYAGLPVAAEGDYLVRYKK